MSEKATATAAPEKTSRRSHEIGRGGGSSARLVPGNPFSGLQQTLGNQAMLQLLEAGVIQAKLRLSQPGDADEQEADRVAEKVVSASHAPTIQRKCACAGGTPYAKCASEDEETIHRSAAAPLLRTSEPSIQRAPAEKSATPEEPPAKTAPHHHATHPLVIEDDAEKIEPHQMRKSQFLALLRTDACATADAVLISVGHSTKGCPYIEKWLGFYEKQSSSHVEAAMRKYAPETATARSAHESIRLLVVRIQKAALSWAKTGKVEGLPPEMAGEITGQKSLLDKVHDFASTGVAGAIFGFIGGKGKSEGSGSSGVMRKANSAEPAPARDAAAVKSKLGLGHSLDSHVQSQMSSAFGYDFSGVRVHTDSGAAKLSSDVQARAFTIGNDVAFASGEYRPGTLVGDALIAHELAHVVQQGGASSASGPMMKGEGEYNALEQDADRSAVGAVMSIWGKTRAALANVSESAMPQSKSGLTLQRCSKNKPTKCALPNAVENGPFHAAVDTPDQAGMEIAITVRSDSGNNADMATVEDSEQVGLSFNHTGSFTGVAPLPSNQSGFMSAVGIPNDRHLAPKALLIDRADNHGGDGSLSKYQLDIYKHPGCGVTTPTVIPNSGYKVKRTIKKTGTQVKLTVEKSAEACTVNGYSTAAGPSPTYSDDVTIRP